jgi:permuted papain-like amidase YaeF/Yiix C92 family enzyme
MLTLLERIEKATSRIDVTRLGPGKADIVTILERKPGSYGLLCADDVLMVDYRSAMSFRVKYCNLGLHKQVKAFRCRYSFPDCVLNSYFAENRDNPYAVIYVIGRMAFRADVTTPLTQVPPIFTKYSTATARAQAVMRLLKEAKPMDLVFSRPLVSSGVSRLIRLVDRSQFSHVGIYLGQGVTVDSGPGGVHKTSLVEFAETSHLALYRHREAISEEQRSKMIEFAEKSIGAPYSWLGLIEVFCRKKLGLRMNRMKPSVSALIFSDNFQLVTYV